MRESQSIHHENREQLQSAESIQTPKFDAILVHGYWMGEHRTGLALRSRLATRAAALAYDNGNGAGKIVIDLGYLWGHNYPAEGILMAKELEDKYSIPKTAIILKTDAYSTGGEVKTAVELARQHGWTRVLDVAFSDHQKSIPEIYKEYNGEDLVTIKSIEEILQEKDHHLVSNIAKRLHKSRYGISYRLAYEPLKRLAMKFPSFTYDYLEGKNKRSRTKKGRDFIIPIDVYKL